MSGSGPLLAYVFWHAPGAEVELAGYEARLADFHAALAAAPPPGFGGSAAWAVGAVPWLAGDVYEDWYLVDGWDALGALNAAAVSGERSAAHDAAAAAAAAGTAGIWAWCGGARGLERAGAADWYGRPPDAPDRAWQAEQVARLAPGESLWRRQMTLGPAPEYCRLGARGRPRRRVWPLARG